jgi:tRNA-binding protein
MDFGPEIGELKSSAQITVRHRLEELPGTQIMAVVNFPPRQIGPFRSEVLVLGAHDSEGHVVLVRPAAHLPNGARLC